MRGYIVGLLEQGGRYDVTEAASGFEALRLLPRASFALIITDINMPDINGLELVRFVRESERHRQTPLIIVSTDGRSADRERGMRLGADAYLIKPFDAAELLAALERVLVK